jgi:hypothetical protein
MASVVAFGQQDEFANAVPKPVGSESATRPEIPQHTAEFCFLDPVHRCGFDQKSAPRANYTRSQPVLIKFRLLRRSSTNLDRDPSFNDSAKVLRMHFCPVQLALTICD